MNLKHEAEVDSILDGLTGDVRLGQRYYVFTVTYAYIGRVAKITPWAIHLEDVTGVNSAGSEADAVTKIVNGKKKPDSFEIFGKPVIVARQAITALIPSDY